MGNYFQKKKLNVHPQTRFAHGRVSVCKAGKNIYDNVPYYRTRMQNKGLEPDDIKSIDDLHKLPFYYKG